MLYHKPKYFRISYLCIKDLILLYIFPFQLLPFCVKITQIIKGFVIRQWMYEIKAYFLYIEFSAYFSLFRIWWDFNNCVRISNNSFNILLYRTLFIENMIPLLVIMIGMKFIGKSVWLVIVGMIEWLGCVLIWKLIELNNSNKNLIRV